jgi:hypothetical protein
MIYYPDDAVYWNYRYFSAGTANLHVETGSGSAWIQAGNFFLPSTTINAIPGLSCYVGELRLYPFIVQGSQWPPADGHELAINSNQSSSQPSEPTSVATGPRHSSCRIIAAYPPAVPSIRSVSETLSIRGLRLVTHIRLAGANDSSRRPFGSWR